ncbi:hypothetical protein B0O80DRAFT_503236 [Mortierella sp. GBAus27b]|nr:hypothetical protein B0O80DRAFT_503236 [Mortierella sp. GBAus27b]
MPRTTTPKHAPTIRMEETEWYSYFQENTSMGSDAMDYLSFQHLRKILEGESQDDIDSWKAAAKVRSDYWTSRRNKELESQGIPLDYMGNDYVTSATHHQQQHTSWTTYNGLYAITDPTLLISSWT